MGEPFVGQISMVAFNFAPRGFAMCNGQILAINTNTALFALLGTTYGGNGQTTFGLPDLRGRLPIHSTAPLNGQGPGLTKVYTFGAATGTETNALTQQNLPLHTHTATFAGGNGSTGPVSVTGTVNLPAVGVTGSLGASATAGSTNTPSASVVPAQASVTIPPTAPKPVNAYGAADGVTKFPLTLAASYAGNVTSVAVTSTGSVTIPAPTGTVTGGPNPTGADLPVNNIQPVLPIYFVICTAGLFPSRN